MTQEEVMAMIKSGTQLFHRQYRNGQAQVFLSTPMKYHYPGNDCGTTFEKTPKPGWGIKHEPTKITKKQADKAIWLLSCSSMHEMTVTENDGCVETIHSWKQPTQ
jgi:hypothetical protein